MGVTKGAADARALADALSGDDIEDGLRSFNAKRKSIGDRVFARGRELGAFLNDDVKDALDEKTGGWPTTDGTDTSIPRHWM